MINIRKDNGGYIILEEKQLYKTRTYEEAVLWKHNHQKQEKERSGSEKEGFEFDPIEIIATVINIPIKIIKAIIKKNK